MTSTERHPPRYLSPGATVEMIREMRAELDGADFVVTVPRKIARRIALRFGSGNPSIRERILGLGYVSKVKGDDIDVIKMETVNAERDMCECGEPADPNTGYCHDCE